MTQEEKAKAYDEALEKARKRVATEPQDHTDAILKDIFPQLRKSEDERIRKEIVDFLRFTLIKRGIKNGKEKADEWIAYLEKQKEDKEELVYRLNGLMQDYIKEGKDDEEKEHRLKCYQLFWDALEDTNFFEQKEQKPTDKIDLKFNIGDTIINKKNGEKCTISNRCLLHQYYSDTNHCHEIKFDEQDDWELVKEQKPAEWSEEDEKHAVRILSLLDEFCGEFSQKKVKDDSGDIIDIDDYSEDYDWFRNRIKNTQPEWSKKDEKMLKELLALIETIEDINKVKDGFLDVKTWLKGLRPKKLDASKLENYDPVEVLNRVKKEWPMALEKVVGKQELSDEEWELNSLAYLEQLGYTCIPEGAHTTEWGEEDEKMLDDICSHLYATPEERGKMQKWLKALSLNRKKNNEDVAKLCSNEWNDEDERNRDRAIFYTRFYQRNEGTTKGSEECIDWLKSLRPQPKQEWNEEDERIIDTIVSVLGQYIDYKSVPGSSFGYATPRYSKEIDWLNSRYHQPKQQGKL